LILAIICESANAARQQSQENMAHERMKHLKEATRSFTIMCEKLDRDQDGVLTFEEIEAGYHSMPEFANFLKVLGLSQEDLLHLYDVMDHDRSGGITTDEFVKECLQLQCTDIASVALYIRMYITKVHNQLEKTMGSMLNSVSDITDKMEAQCTTLQRMESAHELSWSAEAFHGQLPRIGSAQEISRIGSAQELLQELAKVHPDSNEKTRELFCGKVPSPPDNFNEASKKIEDTDAMCQDRLTSIERAIKDLANHTRIQSSMATSIDELRSLLMSSQLDLSSPSARWASPSSPVVTQDPPASRNLPSGLGQCLFEFPRPTTPTRVHNVRSTSAEGDVTSI
jgi:hypothetical protein